MFVLEWLRGELTIERRRFDAATVEEVTRNAIASLDEVKKQFDGKEPDSFRILDRRGLLVTTVVLVKPGDGGRKPRR